MKKYMVIISIFVILILVTSIFFYVSKKDIKLDNVEIKKEVKNNMFAMYKETSDNIYEEITDTNVFPTISDGYILNEEKSKCIDNSGNEIQNILTYNISTNKVIVDTEKTVFCYLYFKSTVYTFDYTGGEQTFTVPYTGTYKIEVWGAQGGSASSIRSGLGGYSYGELDLLKYNKIYINVGGQGNSNSYSPGANYFEGGYNGGGYVSFSPGYASGYVGSGGGATHMALDSGILSTLSSHATDGRILIVAGGGGGAFINNVDGNGATGGDGNSNSTTTSTFGNGCGGAHAGGGGYYGGKCGDGISVSSGGGSGYVTGLNNSSINSGVRAGNGYAKITFIG